MTITNKETWCCEKLKEGVCPECLTCVQCGKTKLTTTCAECTPRIKEYWHVFTNGHDEFFDTFEEADEVYREAIQTTDEVRLYSGGEYWENGEPTGHFTNEEYIDGQGGWPS